MVLELNAFPVVQEELGAGTHADLVVFGSEDEVDGLASKASPGVGITLVARDVAFDAFVGFVAVHPVPVSYGNWARAFVLTALGV